MLGQKMHVQCLTPILNVSNIAESFAWFEKLGWKKCWDWGDPPTFGAVGCGEVEIFLCQGAQGSRGEPMPKHIGDDDTGGVWMSWFLKSPADVDAAHALALQHGMTVTWPPTDEPWGVREFHLRHPDGIRSGLGRARALREVAAGLCQAETASAILNNSSQISFQNCALPLVRCA